MEKMRVAYHEPDGTPGEDYVEAENADDAIAQVGPVKDASVTSLGPADGDLPDEPRPDDEDVNEGDEEPLSLEEAHEADEGELPPE